MIIVRNVYDLEKIKNLSLKIAVSQLFIRSYEIFGDESVIEDFNLNSTGEIRIVENDSEYPDGKIFEYVYENEYDKGLILVAGVLKTNEELITYVIPEYFLSEEHLKKVEEELS